MLGTFKAITEINPGRVLTASVLLGSLSNPRKVGLAKALLAIMLGISGALIAIPKLLMVWPLVVVYLMLVWKESVFSEPLLAKDGSKLQTIQFIAIAATEISFFTFLAHSFAHPDTFVALMIVFLGLKTVWFERKFLLMPKSLFLRRMIKMNVAEILCALATLAAIYLHFTQPALIFLGIVITDLSIYFILIRRSSGLKNLTL